MLSFEIVDSVDSPLVPAARELFEEYAAELGIDLCFQGFSEELSSLPSKYGPPKGALIVVVCDEEPIACGALRELDKETGELKRIYVRPSHRGTGLGRQITVDLLDRARSLGFSKVRLDTLRTLTVAQSLYQSLGFEEIQPYNFNPEPDIIYMERPLLLG